VISNIFILIFFSIEPFNIIQLDRIFETIAVYGDRTYLAPFIGNSIFAIDNSGKLRPISFTDDSNYRIRSFSVKPFAIYLSNGTMIEKYYTASGTKEKIFKANDISSFIVTPDEEVIFFDHYKHELVFLDFTHSVRLLISDLKIKDMYFADSTLYVLTNSKLYSYDEYGNIIQEMEIPNKKTNIIAKDSTIIIYSSDEKDMYILKKEKWEKIELCHGICDIALGHNSLIILDDNGSTLYYYNISDF
jgi:hypothetical protein